MNYQNILHEVAPDVNPAGAEAVMRLAHGTLNHLPREVFADEAEMARRIAAEHPGMLRKVADTFGMAQDYDDWSAKMRASL